MAWENVEWQDLVNVIAEPNSNDLRKNSGASFTWDAGARSLQQINSSAEGVGIEFWMADISGYCGVAAGLSADNPNQHYNTIDFCIRCIPGGESGNPFTKVLEDGIEKFSFESTFGFFKLLINSGGYIEYYAKELLEDPWTFLYTSINLPSYPLFMDTSLCHISIYAAIIDAKIDTVGALPNAPTNLIATCATAQDLSFAPDFDFTPLYGDAPLNVSFTNKSTGSYDTFLWEFGTGDTSTEENPIYEFINPGIYMIRLTISKSLTKSVIAKLIIVGDGSSLPAGVIDWKEIGGKIYAIKAGEDKVYIYDTGWIELGYFGSTGNGNGQFNNPATLDGVDSVYVVDSGNNRIQKFDLNGIYQSQFGAYGSGNGQLNNPFGISTNGIYLYIADYGNSRVQIFDMDGNYITKFTPMAGGQPQAPYDITVDKNYIYVTIKDNDEYQIFTLWGDLLYSYRNPGGGAGQFKTPTYIRDDELFIYITDSGNGRVIVYPKDLNFGYIELGIIDQTLDIINDIHAEE